MVVDVPALPVDSPGSRGRNGLVTPQPGHDLDVGESPTLEVRWVRAGNLDGQIREWFARFPTADESREDDYLIGPDVGELSVKIRAGGALEVKVYRGLLGVLDVPDRAHGLMEYWQKWSFPMGSTQYADESSSWLPVHKLRRMTYFSAQAGRLSADAQPPASGAGCAVELTELTMRGKSWWTLGFEANGPTETLQTLVESTAAQVFAKAIGTQREFALDDSGSYSSWLRHQVEHR